MTAHGLSGVADAGAFLARLTRLDPTAPVRLRASGGRTALWARLPWEVLVTREVAGREPRDATVSAAGLLAVLAGGGVAGRERRDARVAAAGLRAVLAGGGDRLPEPRDAQWRWPLPPAASETV